MSIPAVKVREGVTVEAISSEVTRGIGEAYRPRLATRGVRARAVVAAMVTVAAWPNKAA